MPPKNQYKREGYVADLSDVTVTFNDGEVKTYRITANPTIGSYLARESADTGVFVLFNNDTSTGIPMSQVREYVIEGVTEAQFARETEQQDAPSDTCHHFWGDAYLDDRDRKRHKKCLRCGKTIEVSR